MLVIGQVKEEKEHMFYLKLPDDRGKRRVFPALFIQQSHVVVKLTDICGVHLQVRPLLDEDVGQSLVIAPGVRAGIKN